jgi:hypothetical protein
MEGASRDGLVARRVDLDTISSSVLFKKIWHNMYVDNQVRNTLFIEA